MFPINYRVMGYTGVPGTGLAILCWNYTPIANVSEETLPSSWISQERSIPSFKGWAGFYFCMELWRPPVFSQWFPILQDTVTIRYHKCLSRFTCQWWSFQPSKAKLLVAALAAFSPSRSRCWWDSVVRSNLVVYSSPLLQKRVAQVPLRTWQSPGDDEIRWFLASPRPGSMSGTVEACPTSW